MLLGVAAVGALYALVVHACLKLVPNLASSVRPLSDAAAPLVGPVGATLLAATAVVSCAGALAAWMIGGPRVVFALASRGDLPAALAQVHPSRRTPSVAIVASAVLVWLLTISSTFVSISATSSRRCLRLVTYASICAALLVLRRRDGPAPLPIPLGTVVGGARTAWHDRRTRHGTGGCPGGPRSAIAFAIDELVRKALTPMTRSMRCQCTACDGRSALRVTLTSGTAARRCPAGKSRASPRARRSRRCPRASRSRPKCSWVRLGEQRAALRRR